MQTHGEVPGVMPTQRFESRRDPERFAGGATWHQLQSVMAP